MTQEKIAEIQSKIAEEVNNVVFPRIHTTNIKVGRTVFQDEEMIELELTLNGISNRHIWRSKDYTDELVWFIVWDTLDKLCPRTDIEYAKWTVL